MTYQQSLDYLNSFINHEKSKSFDLAEFSLKPMQELVSLLRLDLAKLKIIHIAGTKGKGSLAQMISATLARSSYKVGVYSSPHILDIRERIKIVSNYEDLISEENFAFVVSKLKHLLLKSRLQVSYFEALTAVAFIYFIEQSVDFLILETGLGGRFDATNVVDPILSIITSIALEHTEILGDNYSSIAKEKAGIVKDGKPVFLGDMPEEAKTAIVKVAKEKHAKCFVYGEHFWANNIVLKNKTVLFDYVLANGATKKLSCAYCSKVQAKNASLAFAVFEYLKGIYCIKDVACEEALLENSLLGRCTKLTFRGYSVVADIAHTVESLADLRDSINIVEPQKEKLYVLGVNRDKKFDEILRVFESEKIVFSSSSNPRALTVHDLNEGQTAAFKALTSSVDKALEGALKLIDRRGIIIVTGSAYLVADLLNYLNSKEVSDAKRT